MSSVAYQNQSIHRLGSADNSVSHKAALLFPCLITPTKSSSFFFYFTTLSSCIIFFHVSFALVWCSYFCYSINVDKSNGHTASLGFYTATTISAEILNRVFFSTSNIDITHASKFTPVRSHLLIQELFASCDNMQEKENQLQSR